MNAIQINHHSFYCFYNKPSRLAIEVYDWMPLYLGGWGDFFCFFNVFNFQVSHEKVQKNLSSGLSNGRSLSQILITVFIHGLKRKFMENCFTLISAMKGNKKSYSVFHNQNLSALWN